MTTATETFTGFSPQAMRFLRGLKKNNERAWFGERKAVYDDDIQPSLQALAADLTAALRKAKIPISAEPRRPAFRIYRDVRFSRDKSPYKTNLGIYLPHEGKRDQPGGLYVHVAPKESFTAAGFYQLDKEPLQLWRAAMSDDAVRFEKILRALGKAGLELSPDEALKRMPRGFEDHANASIAAYFRAGSFMVSERLTDEDVMESSLVERLVAFTRKTRPLLDYGWDILA